MPETYHRYDIDTAVTFFLAGLGAGSLLTLILWAREMSGRRYSVPRATPARSSAAVL